MLDRAILHLQHTDYLSRVCFFEMNRVSKDWFGDTIVQECFLPLLLYRVIQHLFVQIQHHDFEVTIQPLEDVIYLLYEMVFQFQDLIHLEDRVEHEHLPFRVQVHVMEYHIQALRVSASIFYLF